MTNFGPLAAQHDKNLLKYFLVTGQARRIESFSDELSANFFVARPGAGKTALLRYLTRGGQSYLAIRVGSDQVRLRGDPATTSMADLQLMGRFELANALLLEVSKSNQLPRELQDEIDIFLNKHLEGRLMGLLKRLRGAVSSVSALGWGVGLAPEKRAEYLRIISGSRMLDEAEVLLSHTSKHVNILVLVDDPEDIVTIGMKPLDTDNILRLGTLLSILAHCQKYGIRVVAFLRENFYQEVRLKYPYFQHFSDRVDSLGWTASDLLGLLKLRIQQRLELAWKDVFSFRKAWLTARVFPHLVSGPRDLLFLCNTANAVNLPIGTKQFLEGIKNLREEKLAEISRHFPKWPKINILATELARSVKRRIRDNSFSSAQLFQYFSSEFSDTGSALFRIRRDSEWMTDLVADTVPSLQERLYAVGALGYFEIEERVYPWQGRDTERCLRADRLFISPLFWPS